MIYVFSGENTYLRDIAANELVESFKARHGSLSVQKIASDSLTADLLSDVMFAQPFLSDKRLTQIRHLSDNKPMYEEFINNIANVPDTTDVVLIEDHLDARPKTTTILKQNSDFREFTNLDANGLVNWLVNTFADKGSKIGRAEAEYLIDRVGSNQARLNNECQKLSLQNQPITKELIDQLTIASPHSSIFTMLDMVAAGNLNESLKLYEEQKAQGMEPQAILGMITWQLVTLATVAAAKNIDSASIAPKSKLSPFVIRKNQNLSKKLTKQKIIKMFDMALEADTKLKRTNAKPGLVMDQLITDLVLI